MVRRTVIADESKQMQVYDNFEKYRINNGDSVLHLRGQLLERCNPSSMGVFFSTSI